jgi:hypothetical protein
LILGKIIEGSRFFMHNFKIAILLVLMGISFQIQAITLKNKGEKYFFEGNIYVFKDKSGKLELNQVNSPIYKDSFQLVNVQNRVMDDAKVVYWLKIPITNRVSQVPWVMEFFDFRISDLHLYDENNVELGRVGHYQIFRNRSIQHKNFVFQLNIPQDHSTVYYVKIKTDKSDYISGLIHSFEDFTAYSNGEYFFLALFYGILITLMAYNLMVYFSIRGDGDLTFIYYALYILAVCLFSTARDNIGFQFLWANYPVINRFLFPVSELALICFASFYAIQFLDLKNKGPVFYKLILFSLGLRLIIFAALMLSNSVYAYSYDYDMVILLLLFSAGIKSKLNGYTPANYYLAGFAFIMLGYLLNILMDFNIVPANAFTFYSINGGIIVESFFLSLAIASKLRTIYNEKETYHLDVISQLKINEELKEKVNKELEGKVRERTLALQSKTDELIVSNQKLKELSDKINQMNALLDKDNWKLNQEVKEKTKDAIISKELSLEEFSKVFPNEFTCLRYLEDIKWHNGYACKKCGNTKYSEGEIRFSRKCTKCDYIETVKSHTIFQGVKIPLPKCFYILYSVINVKRKVTLNELAATLELRLNTCSDFRKKVNTKMEKVKTQLWEELVLD